MGASLPFEDTTDFDNADRGFLGALSPGMVQAPDGRVVYDADAYAFLKGECPDTANPSLWRQAQLSSKQGLYKVTEGIYQVRGLDLSNMTLVEGERGVVVIDPLISAECAEAALGLYYEHRGEKPVTGLIYTHSHGDHFGGARGVLPRGKDDGVPVLAPEGFLEHAVSENVYAGNAMTRRAVFMYGDRLPKAAACRAAWAQYSSRDRTAPMTMACCNGSWVVARKVRIIAAEESGDVRSTSRMSRRLPQISSPPTTRIRPPITGMGMRSASEPHGARPAEPTHPRPGRGPPTRGHAPTSPSDGLPFRQALRRGAGHRGRAGRVTWDGGPGRGMPKSAVRATLRPPALAVSRHARPDVPRRWTHGRCHAPDRRTPRTMTSAALLVPLRSTAEGRRDLPGHVAASGRLAA